MAQTVLLKRSSVAGNVPGSSDLSLGEIAVNTADGAIYIKKGNNDIVAVADNDILHIDTTNSRIGIGTTSPSNSLHVSSGTDDWPIRADSTDAKAGIIIQDTNTTNYLISQSYTLSIGNQASLHASNLNIKSTGNVGIGTTSPGSKLNVLHSSNATNGITVENATTGTSARSNVRLLSDAGQLDIYTTSSTYNGVSSWTDSGVLSTSSTTSGGLVLNAQSGGIKFQDATTEIMRISDGGNVGINNTSPNAKLTVSGSALIELPSSSNTFKIQDTQNSVERFRVTQAGNVGIGTSSPAAKLHISGNSDVSDADCMLIIDDVDGSAGSRIPAIMFRSNTGGTVTNQGRIRGTDTQGMILSGSSALGKDLVVQSSMIGIATPSNTTLDSNITAYHAPTGSSIKSLLKLWVNTSDNSGNRGGAIEWVGSGDKTAIGSKIAATRVAAGGKMDLRFYTGRNTDSDHEKMRITDGGNVGIGTDSPSETLELTRLGKIGFGMNGSYGARLGYFDDGGGTHGFHIDTKHGGTTVSESRFVVRADSGNVGIGTKTPGYKLEVAEDTNGTADLLFLRNSDTTYAQTWAFQSDTAKDLVITGSSGAGGIKFVPGSRGVTITNKLTINDYTFPTADGSANQVLKTDGSGNLTFATVAGASGGTSISDSDADTKIQVEESSDEDIIRFDTAGSERMQIDALGRVGIGETSAGSTLHVYNSAGATATFKRDADAYLTIDHGSSGANLKSGGTIGFYASGSSVNSLTISSSLFRVNEIAEFTNNVGIGTNTPDAKLQVEHNGGHTSGNVAIQHSSLDLYNPLAANTNEKGSVLTFSDNYFDSPNYPRTTRAAIKGGTDTVGNTADGFLAFYTDAGGANSMPERMRIDSSGNLLVGTTNAANASAGFRAYAGGNGAFTKASTVLDLNRLSTDGTIIQFQKDTVNVGTIGTVSNGKLMMGVGGSSGTNLIFADAFDEIYPSQNGVTTLGDPGAKFKDLHLSGNANIGGNAVITGNLTVNGTQTTLNTATLDVEDLNITVAKGASNSAAANGAGLTVDCGSDTDTTFTYNGSSGQWETNTELVIKPRHTGGTPPTLTLTDLNNQYQAGIVSSGHLTMRASGSGNQYWQNDSTYLMMLADTGELSIGNGTSAPANHRLHIKTAVDDSVSQGLVIERSVNTDRGYINYQGGAFQFRSTVGDPIVFGETDAEHMRILPDGNVGIGTTNPTNHINTGSFFKPDSNGKFLTVNGGANGSFIMLESQTTTDNDQIGGIYWNRTGAQGDAHKQVAGIDVIQDAYAPNNVLEGGTLRFFTKPSGSGLNTPRMVIAGDGNVGIGITSPNVKLAVDGQLSTGDRRLSLGILDLNSGSTPTQFKIITNIPFASGAADFTVNIKGFRYGTNDMVDLSIGWHYYNSTFYNASVKSSGAYAPTVTLGVESSKVVIHLTSPGYWPKLYVESLYSSAYRDSYASGWSWSDSAISSDSGTPTVSPAYSANFGNNFQMKDNGNVGVGIIPGAKFHVSSSSTIGWSNLANASILTGTTSAGIGIDDNEIMAKGAGNLYFGTGGSNEDVIIRAGGTTAAMTIKGSNQRVGIGTDSLTNKFHVSGNARVEGNLMAGGASASNVPARPIHVKSAGDAAAIRIEDTTSSNKVYDIRSTHGEGLHFVDVTGGTTPMTIHTDSNVSVGAPSAQNGKLHVNGTFRVGPYYSTNDRDGFLMIPHGSDTRLQSNNERFHIENNQGNILITPSGHVQIQEYAIDTTSTASSATTQIAIHSFAAADFRSARFTVQVTNSTDSAYHTTELLLVHNGTTANITEFGEIHTGSAVEATFDADVNSGNVRLLATPASTDTMAFKVVCHSITT